MMQALPFVQPVGLSCYRALARAIEQLASAKQRPESYAYLLIIDYITVARNHSLAHQQREELLMNGIFLLMDLCDKHAYVCNSNSNHSNSIDTSLRMGWYQICIDPLLAGSHWQGDVQGDSHHVSEQVQVQGQDLSTFASAIIGWLVGALEFVHQQIHRRTKQPNSIQINPNQPNSTACV
jgi:hypothetical protein